MIVLVEAAVADRRFDRGDRIGAADAAVDASSGRSREERQRRLQRPIGVLAIADVRDQQGELTGALLSPAANLGQQSLRRRGPLLRAGSCGR